LFNITKEELIAFEDRIYDLFEKGDLPYLIHLCGGNEDQLIEIFSDIKKGDYIFSTHRTHYHYLLAGGPPDDLENKIKRGDSMYVFNKDLNFLSSAVLAGCTGMAAGVALSFKMQNKNNKVWCFLGDGAEDEGHFYEAVSFVSGWDLPCTFIIEDNDRQVDTTKIERRGKDIPMEWPSCVKRYHYTPRYPHASTGSGKMVKFKEEVVENYKNSNEYTKVK
jgi:TPP-dependent pyruvate/acetoin dehydrogenase alpha subunit